MSFPRVVPAAWALVALIALAGACAPRSRVVTTAPRAEPAETMTGTASWYGRKFHGRLTASGERYDMFEMTAAHRTLAFGTVLRVTRLDNGRSVRVRVTDRGPFVDGRIIDLSYGAAKKIGMIRDGIARVRLEIVR